MISVLALSTAVHRDEISEKPLSNVVFAFGSPNHVNEKIEHFAARDASTSTERRDLGIDDE